MFTATRPRAYKKATASLLLVKSVEGRKVVVLESATIGSVRGEAL